MALSSCRNFWIHLTTSLRQLLDSLLTSSLLLDDMSALWIFLQASYMISRTANCGIRRDKVREDVVV